MKKTENIYKVKTSETNLHCEVLSCIIYKRLKEKISSFPASLLQRKLKAFPQPILLPQRESSNRLYDQLNVARFAETQIINILRWNSTNESPQTDIVFIQEIWREKLNLFSLVLFSGSRHLKFRFQHFLSCQQWAGREKKENKQNI